MYEWTTVARTDELAEGERKRVEVGGREVLLVNLGGDFVAVENLCSHDGAGLEEGVIEEGCIVCPRHRARFDLRSGEVLAPPAYEGIRSYPVRIVDGQVQIGDEE